MDYLNWRNLGYKKNGTLAFFDVGFGNPFLEPHGAEKVEVSEDSTSLYSTPTSVGSDNNPIYNQNNLPPTIDNNLDANRAMYESKKSYMPNSKTVSIKKKCRLGGLGNTSVACNQGDISNLKFGNINEGSIPYNKTFWAWVSPNNQFIEVPQLQHQGYIMRVYKDKDYGWDYDRVFNQALKDGWVRVIFEYNRDRFMGSLSINGYDEARVRSVFKNMFFDLIKYGHNVVYVDAENPKESRAFSTRTEEGKAKMIDYISENLNKNPDTQWFSGSKVVDDAGNPLVVYHGTNKDFSRFNLKNAAQPIIWFSSDKDKIERGESGAAGRSRIISAYLSIKKMAGWEEYEKYGLGQLRDMGYDGAKLDDDYFVFSPKQIKIINNGKKGVNENVDAREARGDEKSLQTILDGKRNIALIGLSNPIIKEKVNNAGLNIIKINQTNHPDSIETSIVYRDGHDKQANRLHNIMKSHGGYVSDQSPREAYEIGKLLEYTDESILQYINRIYVKVPSGGYRRRTNAELQQYDDNRIKQIPSEEEEFKKYMAIDETLGELDKVYVRTGLYDDEDRKEIVDITHGDNYTKFIADLFYYLANRYNKERVEPTRLNDRDRQILIDAYNRIKRYDKNVLPIHDLYAREHNAHPLEKLNDLKTRELLIDRIKSLPSILLRNLRGDIRKERDHYELEKLLEYTRNIQNSLKLIGQTKPEHQEKIMKKVFSSANDTFEAVSKRLEDTTIPYLSQDDSLENTVEKVRDMGDEAEILYNGNNVLVVKINSPEAMGYIGCSSQWCFASNPQAYWSQYTSGDDGFATIVFNFDEEPSEPNAMVVVLENGSVYNMYNEYMEEGGEYLDELGVSEYIPEGEYEMAENVIFAKNNNMNEVELMSLQELPFKDEILNLGGKIYSVGGAVRDEFLGKESKDLDILISGIPMDKLEEILSKYGRVDAVGKSFGILKFKPKGSTEDIDIAIPRTEKPTGEGGHKGFEVSSSHELPIEKDLERRDFTINTIAKDIDGNIVDPYGGQKDLQDKIIRVVNPEAFSDDPLRMLRAVQFASRFGFTIEPETMKMIQDNAERIKEIPPERILTEFDKIVKGGNKLTGAFLLKQTGLLRNIFGKDLGILVGQNVWENVKTMGEFIYLLSHNLVENPAEFYKNRLKGDIDTYKEIRALQLAFESGEATNLVEARSIAHNMYVISSQSLQSNIIPKVIKTAAQELLSGKYPKTIGELAVNGNDLMSLGLQGKQIGNTLKMMLLKIYSGGVINKKEDLLALTSQNKKNLNESYLKHTWNVNGEDVDINFFIKKYDEWNHRGGGAGYTDPSKESVLEFLQNNYEDFSHDEVLNHELFWALTDREVLN